jgi:ABC-2 type transport system ATP-binding protein
VIPVGKIENAMAETGVLSPADALVLDRVTKRFRSGKRIICALDQVSARCRHGIVTGLIGPDAAGKTTLMRLLAGLLVPDEGSVTVLGMDVVKNPLLVQRALGYMPQRFGLYGDLTVQENLNLYADLHAVAYSDRQERYDELMHMTGMAPFTGRLARDLSGGMKQKLGLACTLVRAPQLLLLDEPTVGVDPVSRRELWGIVYRLVEKEGLSVLLSTAYLDEAERCREVILMHEGKVLDQGSPQSFSRRLTGRTFQVLAPGVNKRRLQEQLITGEGVLDATIQAEGVRVVTKEGATLRPPPELAGCVGFQILPVEPRFEDSFIVILKERIHGASSAAERPLVQPATTRDENVIVVQDVKRRFGNFYAVKGISFSVRHGEVFGLLGANGAGKSTTFRMLCGLLPASEGILHVAGEDLRRAAAKARSRIGYMAQHFSLYADLSVAENLTFFSRAYGLRGQEQRERIAWGLDEFELRPYADMTSGQMPLGYKQRLALAAALMHSPEILFLDEPTSGVDPLARRDFWHRINGLANQGVTLLVTTHFMEEAEYCDRVVIMAQGVILAEGTPEELKARFQTPERPKPTMEDAFIGLLESEGNDAETRG